MIKRAFHDENMSITQASEWYSCFKSGKISSQGFKRSGRPSSSCSDEIVGKKHQVIWCMTNDVFNILPIRGVAIKKPDSCSKPLLKKNQTIEMLSPSM